jgi:alpha-1,2-mannosyltransferase
MIFRPTHWVCWSGYVRNRRLRFDRDPIPGLVVLVPNVSRLNRAEKWSVGLLLLLVVAFGVVVEIRSAFQKVRRTDFGVYTRAAWAVQQDRNIYEIEDDRGWHYCYPPPFAIFMTPLADPPAGESRFGYLPFSVSVGIWYFFSVACFAYAVDRFAKAVLPEPIAGSRRWWSARTWPFTIAIGAIGYTLARGQVNLLIVAMVAGMFASLARGHRFRAGLWLGAAISIKVIPAFLGLYLLWKRDTRAVGGVVVSLVVLLFVLPSAIWGVPGTIELNRQMIRTVLQPGSTGEGDQTRARELTNATATDSQSFQSMIHNWLHPDPKTRPATVSHETRLAHWLTGAVLTLGLLFAAWRMPTSPANDLVFLGCLTVLMLHLTPVSHMHYYAYSLPLVCGLWLKSQSEHEGRVFADPRTFRVLAVWGLATATPLLPGELADACRAFGFGQFASLGMLVYASCQLLPQSQCPSSAKATPIRIRNAA